LKEVERYTRDASRAMMADSGMAKVLTNHPARFVKNRQLPEMKG
jgi:hypothetical protein